MLGSSRSAGTVARLSAMSGVSTASEMATFAEYDSSTGKLLPVLPELSAALPFGGLRRGSTVAVRGSRSLVLALLAEATTRGSWAAVVGMPDIGVVAAAELGVAVHRLALVPSPGHELMSVTGALLDGVDLVVLGESLLAGQDLSRRAAEQLSRRARHRGAVLLGAGPLPGAEIELSCAPGRWQGFGALDTGHGYLSGRGAAVHSTGRGAAARPRRASVLLPGPSGRVLADHSTEVEPSADVEPMLGVG